MAKSIFAAAINCMDGRVQLPVTELMKEEYGVEYVDMITEAGPIKYLSENKKTGVIESIKNRVAVSINAHGSRILAVVGHHDCAGNPVDKEAQIRQMDDSISLIKSWDYDIQVVKLWVDHSWRAHII
jgi:carbonic anhydrase